MQDIAIDQASGRVQTGIYNPAIESYKVFSTDLGSLFEGDCLDILPYIYSQSIDTVFADPPFNLSKKYGPSPSLLVSCFYFNNILN